MCGSHHHGEERGCGCHEGHGHHETDCGCGAHGGEEREVGCGCGGHHGYHPGHHHHEHGYLASHQGGCCCQSWGESFGFHRHFPTRPERIARLEAYLKDLEAEVQGVREHLEGLRSTTPETRP